MNPIKTKPPGRVPRIKADAARAPKELMRRSLLEVKDPNTAGNIRIFSRYASANERYTF